MAPPVLQFRKVVKRFEMVTAVNAVSLTVHRDEIFTLLGPSGCGKTTILRLVVGLEEPDGGAAVGSSYPMEIAFRRAWTPPDRREATQIDAIVSKSTILATASSITASGGWPGGSDRDEKRALGRWG